MKKGIKVKTLFIGIIAFIVIVTVVISVLIIKAKGSGQNVVSSIVGGEAVESSQNTNIDIKDYEDKFREIKFITDDGVLYEDDEIKVTAYDSSDYEEYEELAFNTDGKMNPISVYNKTSNELECEMTRATMSGCSILPTYPDQDIEEGEEISFLFNKPLYIKEIIETMGIGAFNNIELELKLSYYDDNWNKEEEVKKIEIKTDCKEKAKQFNLQKSKIYDKNGLKLFIENKYIEDNTRIAETVKGNTTNSAKNEYFAGKVIQNTASLFLIAENDTDEDKEIEIRVECNNKDVSKYYFSGGSDTEKEKIEHNMIDTIITSPMSVGGWIEEDKAYNPNDIKYIIMVDGKECYTVDFTDARVM